MYEYDCVHIVMFLLYEYECVYCVVMFSLYMYMYISLLLSRSDEDDTAELLRELQKIKKERAEEQARKVGR